MRADFQIQIQLVDDAGAELKLDKVFIDALIYLQSNVRYTFSAGLTDSKGRLVVSFDQLEKIRLRNQAFSVMDYNTSLEDCDSTIGISVPSSATLRQRHEAIQKWFPDEAKLEVPNNNNLILSNEVIIDIDINRQSKVNLEIKKK